jgi:hypothetical protein
VEDAYEFRHVRVRVRVSAGISADPNGWIVVKGLLRKSVGKFQIWLKWDKNVGHHTYVTRACSILFAVKYVEQQYREIVTASIFITLLTVPCLRQQKRERIFAFPWQHWLPERDALLTLYERAHCLPCSCLVCLCTTASFVVCLQECGTV